MKTDNILEIRLLKDAKLSLKLALHQWYLSYFHCGSSDNHSVSGVKIKLYVHLLVLSSKEHRQKYPLKSDFKQ